jgi:hypothetical protein
VKPRWQNLVLEKKQIIMGPCCGFLPTKFKVAYIA